MSDDKTKRIPQDANKVNIHEPYEVEYWTKKWGVTKEKLQEAVKNVGVSSAAVAKYLGK
jgi:hypothetical protein